jgi:preprotein translocase subunit SecG
MQRYLIPAGALMVVTVVLIIYVLIQEQQPTDSRKMTFAECEAIGGEP